MAVLFKHVSGLNREKIRVIKDETLIETAPEKYTTLPVFFDACQQGLQPAHSTLAVSVQEGDDLTFGSGRSPEPGSDQT